MKTIGDWLNELPDPYKTLAIKYHSNYSKMGKADCLENALVLGFKWSSSKEGSAFWKEVHKMCMSGEFDNKPIPNRSYNSNNNKSIKEKFIKSNKYSGVKIKKTKKKLVQFEKPVIKEIEPINYIHASTVYPDLDSALESIFKPFIDRKKQIDKL